MLADGFGWGGRFAGEDGGGVVDGVFEKFHAEYIKFFEDSVNDPTSVLTRKPPAPAEPVRQHYADVEQHTAACKDARFFAQGT